MADDAPMAGQVIWHDYFSNSTSAARRFYADLLGWSYREEHATKFVWTGGEADYPLIMMNGEAHGGFVNPRETIASHWRAYVAVEDVDRSTEQAANLGAAVSDMPFDVEGVGRVAVIRDRQGASICLFKRAYDLPAPTAVFARDDLFTHDTTDAMAFYGFLFGWKPKKTSAEASHPYTEFLIEKETVVAGAAVALGVTQEDAYWMPYLTTQNIDAVFDQAISLGAKINDDIHAVPGRGLIARLTDPFGAPFGLQEQVDHEGTSM